MNTQISFRVPLCCMFAFIAFISGCHKKPVNGQVFIVTQGAESHKMALVPVYYLNEENTKLLQEKFIAEVKATKETRAKEEEAAYAKLKESMSTMTECSDASKAASDKDDEIEAAIDAITKTIPSHKPTPDPQFADLLAQQIAEYDKIVEAVKAKKEELYKALAKQHDLVAYTEKRLIAAKKTLYDNAKVHNAALAANETLSFNDLASILESILPQFPASTKTDIDGKFILTDAVSKKSTLIAFAKRMTGADWEKYLWVGVLPGKLPNDTLMLSNDNMLPKDKLTEAGFTPSQF